MKKQRTIAAILRTWVLALVMLTQGCVNDGSTVTCAIAAFPAPELGADKQITFRNSAGERIEKDGLLLVLRFRGMYYARSNGTQAAEIVEIRNGRATIRDEWLLASVWMDVTWFPLIGFLVQPLVDIRLVPMIPGYHINPREVVHRWCFSLRLPIHGIPRSGFGCRKNDVGGCGPVTMAESAKAPKQARESWQEVKWELECELGRGFPKPARWRSGRDNVERFVRMIDENVLHSSEASPATSQPVAE